MTEQNVKKDPTIVPCLCSEFTDLKISSFFKKPMLIINLLNIYY